MLRIPIGNSLARECLASDLYETSAGWLMHNALSHPTKRRSAGIRGGEILTIIAEPEAWDHYTQWLRQRYRYTPADYVHPDRAFAQMALSTASRISRELLRLANHPAYRGIGVAGVDPTILPARRMCDQDRWWPTVRMAMRSEGCEGGDLQSGELYPTVLKIGKRTFTSWQIRETSSVPTESPTTPVRRVRSSLPQPRS